MVALPSAPGIAEASGAVVRARGFGLPPELALFFSRPTSRSLTVRGPPGAGKTSLALAALRAFEGVRVYVSSQVPRDDLVGQFPWLARPDAVPVELVELLGYRDSEGRSDLRVGPLRDALQARANDLVELAQVLNLPPALHALLAAHPDEPKMVVVDSWEAWMENLLGPTPLAVAVPTTRWELERAVLGQITRTGARAILVAEREEISRFDYLADGVVELLAGQVDGRQERWLRLTKLRGTPIDYGTYAFTLEGGLFRSLPPGFSKLGAGPAPFARDPSPGAPGLWLGSAAWSRWLGRLPDGRSLLVEVDSEVPERIVWALVLPMIRSALDGGGRIVMRPPENVPIGEVLDDLDAGRTDVSERVRLVSAGDRGAPGSLAARLSFGPEDRLRSYLAGDPDATPDAQEVVWQEVALFLGEPRPAVGATDLLVAFPAAPIGGPGEPADRTDALLTFPLAGRFPPARLAQVVVARADDPRTPRLRARSAMHLSVRGLRGQVGVVGVRPWTPILVPSFRAAGPDRDDPFELVPIM